MQSLQKYRVKDNYYEKRVIKVNGPDEWVVTDIRAKPYNHADLVRVNKRLNKHL